MNSSNNDDDDDDDATLHGGGDGNISSRPQNWMTPLSTLSKTIATKIFGKGKTPTAPTEPCAKLLFYRNVGGGGLTKAKNCPAKVCRDLVEHIKPKLEPTWVTMGISESAIDFEIYEVDKSQENPVPVRKEQDDIVKANCVYTIYESLLEVPETGVFRRVASPYAQVTTYTHPDKEAARAFTMKSPLGCAAMTKTERKLIYYSAHQDGSVKINGMSLDFMDSYSPLKAPIDPYGDVQIGEKKKTKTSMSLDQVQSLLRNEEVFDPQQGGLLGTSLFSKVTGELQGGKNSMALCKIPKSQHPEGQATKRFVNLRYLLAGKTKLWPHNMKLILDNSPHEFHCSMVRTKVVEQPLRSWIPLYRREPNGPFLPEEAVDAIEAGNNIDEVLQEIAFALDPNGEPEVFFATAISSDRVAVFPKLACHYTLHDIIMEAQAEPQPPRRFASDEHHEMFNAIKSLSQVNSDPRTQWLIDKMEDNAYDKNQLSCIECSLLMEAFQCAPAEYDWDSEEGMKAMESLDKGWKLLSDHLDSFKPSSTLLATPAPS